jgi:pimeloyl-ACP methyl ester carboxylesterase
VADTIFMIHGMWVGPWYWDNFRLYFEVRGYRCVTPTLPYHDMDPRDTPDPRLGTTSLLAYADFLESQIATLGTIPIIMGHSMGGLLAQILGARIQAKALVLLTPASPAGIIGLRCSVIKSFKSIQTRWGFWRRPMRQTRPEAIYAMLHLLPEAEQQAICDRLVYESGRAASEIGLWLLDPKGASRVDSSRVTCPVLVVAGAQDRITPASVVHRVARKYRAVSTWKKFADHAHWVLAEPGWEDVAAYVDDWLKSV